MRAFLPISLLLLTAAPALAQVPSPISGPNDSIPSPVCDVINFGFCPQPAPPSPAFYDPDAEAAAARQPAVIPPPVHHRRHRRHHAAQ